MIERGTALDVRERIGTFLRDTALADADARIVPLTGDASDRTYFRVLCSDSRSIVLAIHSGPIDFETLTFPTVARLFEQMRLPVPAIYGHSDALGIIALQDLGDVTLQAHLGAAPATEHAALYRDAVALIDVMQRRGAEFASQRVTPYALAFDVEKLTWELNFFVRHFLEAYRAAVLTDPERDALGHEWRAITEELAAEPRVLCHRDYHSRNLMLHDGSLYVIDFQDARMGPDTYDLVSLLRDSYVDIAERDLDELMAYFLALRSGDTPLTPGGGAAAEFRRRFDLMAVQRNLKALGTFGYQTTTRNNPVYIQYIPRTLRYVRENLERYPRFARLRELLAAHVDELK